MSRTYRKPGHSRIWRFSDYTVDPDTSVWTWFTPKVLRDGQACGPDKSWKQMCNRIDRRRWNKEAKKEEPQLPRNHRRWGIWNWW